MRVIKEHVTHPEHSFRFLSFEAEAFAGARHRHRQLELTWVERGVGVRFVGDSVAPFEHGDLVLLGSEVPHSWVSARATTAEPLAATVIQFPPELLEQPGIPELAALLPLATRAQRGLAVTGECHARVTDQLARLRACDSLGRLAGLIEILRQLSARPSDLRDIASAATLPLGDAGRERRIDRVIDWIRVQLGSPLDINDAARIAHVTPAAFSRFFRRETGKTYTDYVNAVRCSEACVKLRQSSLPISAIAAQCGFRSSSHFNRQFLARIGMEPGAYRRHR